MHLNSAGRWKFISARSFSKCGKTITKLKVTVTKRTTQSFNLSSTPKNTTFTGRASVVNETPGSNKRQRDSDSIGSADSTPFPKKLKKVLMAPPIDKAEVSFVRQLVLLVPDSDEFTLFGKAHEEKINGSVLRAIREEVNPEVKFDFSGFDRGRYKFICPNAIAKEWALNITPKLTGLWNDAKIKAVDEGDCPKMVKASVTFNGKAPNMIDLFEGIENKNPTLDTLHWREYKRQKVQGEKTVLFIGVDEGSIKGLRDLGFRPYFEAGRIKLNVLNNNNGN